MSKPKPVKTVFTPEDTVFWKRLFWGTSALLFAVALVLAIGSGINGDDEYQNDYSEKLVDYYLSFGQDTAALNIPKGNMQLYGGFFELLTGLTNRALGFSPNDLAYHDVRHIYNVLFGFLAMLFAALFVRELAGWRYGLLALLFIWLSPRFLGHSLMNPKDIPFAMGYIMAVYYMLRWLKNMPQYRWGDLIGLAAGIGIAPGLRAGGLLLFAYLGLFAGLDFLFKYGLKGLLKEVKALRLYLLIGLGYYMHRKLHEPDDMEAFWESKTDWNSGFGVGIERLLGERWSLKVDLNFTYRYRQDRESIAPWPQIGLFFYW